MALPNEYELVVILRPDIDDSQRKALLEKIEGVVTGTGAQLLIRDDWGSRKLAYPINKHSKGFYSLINFLGSPTVIDEIERQLRITEAVIRFLTTRIADAVDVPARLEEAAEQRRVKAEEAAKAAAEAEERARLEAEARAAAEAYTRGSEQDLQQNV